MFSLTALALVLLACIPPSAVIEVGEEPAWRSGWSAKPEASKELELSTKPIVTDLDRPVDIKHAGDGTNRLFVVQQEGTIVIVEEGRVRERPFLDIRDQVGCCGEQGLLGLAVHPDFERNGWLFVYYTNKEGTSVLSRF